MFKYFGLYLFIRSELETMETELNAIAVPATIIPLLVILAPLTFAMPIVIAFFTTKSYANGTKLDRGVAAKHGAVTGIVYAVVLIAIALFFITVNYAIAALVWGSLEVLGEGILVVAVTFILGLPVLGVISIINGAVGGVVYSYLKNE